MLAIVGDCWHGNADSTEQPTSFLVMTLYRLLGIYYEWLSKKYHDSFNHR